MANQGLIGSFLETFSGLQDMERQKRKDQELIAQQAVDNELRRADIGLRREQFTQLDKDRDERLALAKQTEARQATNTESLIGSRERRAALNIEKFGQAVKNAEWQKVRPIVQAGENLFKFYQQQGIDDATAQQMAEEHMMGLAQKAGVQMPSAQPTGVPTGAGPISLSGEFGGGPSRMADAPPIARQGNVLPKIAAQMAHYAKQDEKIDSAIALDKKKTEEIGERIAEKVANRAVQEQFKKNQVRLQEERLKIMPLEATAKRVGINTEILRQQKLRGEIEAGIIQRAIQNLKLQQEQNSPKWSEDAKNTRVWLSQEFTSADVGVRNALKHLTQLKERQRNEDIIEGNLASMVKSGKATPQQLAEYDNVLQANRERKASIAFYQGEYDKAAKQRTQYKNGLDALMGIGQTPMGPNGRPDKRVMKAAGAMRVPSNAALLTTTGQTVTPKGTAENPFTITNAEQFKRVVPIGGYFLYKGQLRRREK